MTTKEGHLCGFETLPITLQTTTLHAISDPVTGKAGPAPSVVFIWFSAVQCLHGLQNRVLEKTFQNGEVARLTSCPAQSSRFLEKVPVDCQGLAHKLTNRGCGIWLCSESSQVLRSSKDLSAPSPIPDRGPQPHALGNVLYLSSFCLTEACVFPVPSLRSLLRLPQASKC